MDNEYSYREGSGFNKPGMPSVRPLVDPEELGEVDPTK